MKITKADIASGPELHRMYFEYLQDIGAPRFPNPDIWFYNFRDPTYFCLFMKHGKKRVGFVQGRIFPFYEKPVAEIEIFYIKRGFKRMKFIRGLYVALRRHLVENKVGEAARRNPKHKLKILRGIS